jgi:8-amino-7-oxononanoate synthase
VVPVILGNSLACLRVAERLFEQDIQVHPILYPAVPEEASRLRFFITAGHDETGLAQAAQATAEAVAWASRQAAQ